MGVVYTYGGSKWGLGQLRGDKWKIMSIWGGGVGTFFLAFQGVDLASLIVSGG